MANETILGGPSSTNPQAFTGRKGTVDEGKDFEELMIISKCLQLTLDSNVVEFGISSDDAAFGDFDDLVIETRDINDKEEKIAFQLKHFEAKDKLLTPKILGGTGDKLSIWKYYKSCRKIPADFSLILYTNKKFEMKDEKITMDCKIGTANILVDILKANINNLYRFTVNNSVNISGETKAYEKFLNRFQLMSNQENVKQLEIRVVNHFLGLHGTEDTFHRFRDFIKRWKKEKKHKLNKKMVTIKIVESLLSPHIKTISDELYYTDFGDLLRRAVLSFNLTTFEETNEVIHKIWINNSTDNEVNKCGFNNFLLKERLEQIMDEKLRGLKYSLISWHLGQSPLIVEVTKNSKAAIYQAVELLDKNQIEDRKLLLLDQKKTFQNSRSFQNLDCLKTANQSVYHEILEKFSCRLQGRLHKLQDVVDSEDFAKIVNTDCLVKIIDPNFNIGGQAEELPEFYVPRVLPRILIDFKFLEEEKTDIILINCHGKKEEVKKRIKDVRIIFEADELLSEEKTLLGVVIDKTKKIICLHPTECSPEEYSAIIKKFPTKNCHHFSYWEKCLEWMDTRGDVEGLRSYRTAREMFEEEDAFLQSSRRLIKVVCADPGMGKTTMLKHFYKLKSKSSWLLHLTARQYASRITEDTDVRNFVLSLTTDRLERKFVETFYARRKIIFMWDGLDEVLDNKERQNIYGFIKNIQQLGFVQFLAARCNLQEELEEKFVTLATNIKELTRFEQDSFLKNRLSRKYSKEQLLVIAAKIAGNVTYMEAHKILGVPLQLFLLTELFLHVSNSDDVIKHPLTATKLLEHFVTNKFTTHFIKVKNEDKFIRRIVQESTIKKYKLLGTKICLESIADLNFLEQSELSDLADIETEDDPFGFVKSEEMTLFVHQSYAEYFAALFLSDNYRRIVDFKKLYFDGRCTNLRFMLDLILARDCPAHTAVLYRDLGTLDDHKKGILKKDRAGRNAVHIALSWGNNELSSYEGFRRFLTTVASAEQKPFSERIEDFLAKFKTVGRILDYLLGESQELKPVFDSMFNIDYVSYSNGHLLKLAAVSNDIDVVKFIHQNDEEDGSVPLIYAAAIGNLEISKFFINNGAKVNCSDEGNFITPLICASARGFLQIAKVLIENKADVNMTASEGRTPLFFSAANNQLPLVQLLIENNAEVNLPNQNRVVPLMAAAECGYLEIAKILLDNKSEVNLVESEGRSALSLAAMKNHPSLVKLLIKNKAEVNLQEKDGQTPLYWSVVNNELPVVQLLIANNAEVNLPKETDVTPLMVAAELGHLGVAQFLIDNKAEVNVVSQERGSPLLLAARNNQLQMVQLLIDNKALVNLPIKKMGLTPLITAAGVGHLDIVKNLLDNKAKVNMTDSEGRSPLFQAVWNNHLEMVKLLIANNVDVNLSEITGSTPLFGAAIKGYLDIAKILIDNGAEVNKTDKFGQDSLCFAARHNHIRIAQLLIENGAEINHESERGLTPLMMAVQEGFLDMARFLIDNKAEVNPRYSEGRKTPLMLAIFGNNLPMVRLLIDNQANIDQPASSGVTPLFLACWLGYYEIVKYLLEKKAKINSKYSYGNTVLHIAVEKNNLDIIKVLIAHGADVEAKDYFGRTPAELPDQSPEVLNYFQSIEVLWPIWPFLQWYFKNRRQ